MQKKFVEVNADSSPSKNPYAIRNYMGDNVTTEWNVENCRPRNRVCQEKPKCKKTVCVCKEHNLLKVAQPYRK